MFSSLRKYIIWDANRISAKSQPTHNQPLTWCCWSLNFYTIKAAVYIHMSVEVVCSFLGRSGTLWTKQYQHNTQQEVSCNMVVSQKRLNFFQLINISFNCSFLFILIPSSNQLASFYAFIFLMKSSLPSFGNALNVAIFSCYCCSFIHNRMVGMLHL